MAQKKQLDMTPALEYFFLALEKENDRREREEAEQSEKFSIEIEKVESFVRSLKTQNIFIYTVGLAGKPESTILSKAIFSLNRVVKIYYSTSFDERDSGFLLVRVSDEEGKIVVERVHGYRSVPERLYASQDQCHIIRYLTKWILKRVDWHKTKVHTLDLFTLFENERKKKLEEAMFESESWIEEV